MAWCLVWASGRREVRLDRKSLFFFSADNEKDAWRIIPGMLASSLSWGLSMTVHSFILGHLGTDATAAYSVVSVAQQLIQCLTQGISGGAGIILGQLLGANLLDKAKEYGKRYWKEPQSKKAFETSLHKLGLDYLDLYLIHQPMSDYYGAWRAMGNCTRKGRSVPSVYVISILTGLPTCARI